MNFIKLKDQFFFTEEDVKEVGTPSISNDAIRIFPIDLDNAKLQQIYNLMPVHARHLLTISGVKITGQLPPHIDDAKTSILVYVSTEGVRTQFYKLKTSNPKILHESTLSGSTASTEISKIAYKPETYSWADLSKDDSYVANNYDAYCMNGTSIHTIIPGITREINRTFILVTFANTSFDSVVSLLKETNSI